MSANPNEFDGLQRLVDPANVIDVQGRDLRLEDLDRAKQCVRTNDGRHVMIFTKRSCSASARASLSRRATDYWSSRPSRRAGPLRRF